MQDGQHFSQDASPTRPAVDLPVVVPDLDPGWFGGSDQVEQPIASESNQDDVADLNRRRVAGLDRDEIAVEDPRSHGMSAGSDLDRAALPQAVDGMRNPTHEIPPSNMKLKTDEEIAGRSGFRTAA
jgi:hypothetical protein